MIEISHIDLAFSLKGKSLPLDNGYIIYSALSRICPNLHELTNIFIHPIAGIPNESGKKWGKYFKMTSCQKLQRPSFISSK